MLNPYHTAINVPKVLEIQNRQYQNAMPLEQEVPANDQIDASVQVTSSGNFMLMSMTGSYTTKYLDGQDVADDGICRIFIQLLDGSNQRPLFDDFIAANLFLSPGRVRAVAGLGDASDQLYLEFPFVYTFPVNGAILVRIRNTSDYANVVRIMFKGIRIFAANRQG
jgi:hypothetical protein